MTEIQNKENSQRMRRTACHCSHFLKKSVPQDNSTNNISILLLLLILSLSCYWIIIPSHTHSYKAKHVCFMASFPPFIWSHDQTWQLFYKRTYCISSSALYYWNIMLYKSHDDELLLHWERMVSVYITAVVWQLWQKNYYLKRLFIHILCKIKRVQRVASFWQVNHNQREIGDRCEIKADNILSNTATWMQHWQNKKSSVHEHIHPKSFIASLTFG